MFQDLSQTLSFLEQAVVVHINNFPKAITRQLYSIFYTSAIFVTQKNKKGNGNHCPCLELRIVGSMKKI